MKDDNPLLPYVKMYFFLSKKYENTYLNELVKHILSTSFTHTNDADYQTKKSALYKKQEETNKLKELQKKVKELSVSTKEIEDKILLHESDIKRLKNDVAEEFGNYFKKKAMEIYGNPYNADQKIKDIYGKKTELREILQKDYTPKKEPLDWVKDEAQIIDFFFYCIDRTRFMAEKSGVYMYAPGLEKVAADMAKIVVEPARISIPAFGVQNPETIITQLISKQNVEMIDVDLEEFVGKQWRKFGKSTFEGYNISYNNTLYASYDVEVYILETLVVRGDGNPEKLLWLKYIANKTNKLSSFKTMQLYESEKKQESGKIFDHDGNSNIDIIIGHSESEILLDIYKPGIDQKETQSPPQTPQPPPAPQQPSGLKDILKGMMPSMSSSKVPSQSFDFRNPENFAIVQSWILDDLSRRNRRLAMDNGKAIGGWTLQDEKDAYKIFPLVKEVLAMMDGSWKGVQTLYRKYLQCQNKSSPTSSQTSSQIYLPFLQAYGLTETNVNETEAKDYITNSSNSVEYTFSPTVYTIPVSSGGGGSISRPRNTMRRRRRVGGGRPFRSHKKK